jgi:hypothetical protein
MTAQHRAAEKAGSGLPAMPAEDGNAEPFELVSRVNGPFGD